MNVDVAVIGGGPAGLAAAIAARENGAQSVLILERDTSLGGILQQCIHNGFGLHYFGEELTGPEYAERFIDKAKPLGIDVKMDTMVVSLESNKKIIAVNKEDGVFSVTPKAVVLAMGCRERTRGALNIAGTRPAGVMTAGSAQYMVNMQGYMPGNEVVVLGSGDIGLIMARRMTWEGAKVKLVCELMPFSSGLARNISQCLVDNNIPLKFSHTVVKIHGNKRLEGVTVAGVDKNLKPIPETYEFIPCDTLLLSVGLIPENELTREAEIAIDPVTKGAVVDEKRQTSVPGVFACGNVLHVHDLVDNVSNEAEIAGKYAALFNEGDKVNSYMNVTCGENVSYCVPQKISYGINEDIDIYFRVRNIIKPAVVTVDSHDGEKLKKNKQICTPGEMEKISVPGAVINDAKSIRVNVESR